MDPVWCSSWTHYAAALSKPAWLICRPAMFCCAQQQAPWLWLTVQHLLAVPSPGLRLAVLFGQ